MEAGLSVLLVDPDIEHRASVKQELATRGYNVIGESVYGPEAAKKASELRPEVILVHVEQPMAFALRTLEMVQYAAPTSTTLVMTRANDTETVRAITLAGARAVLRSPLDGDEVDDVLTRAREHHRRLMNPGLVTEKVATSGTVISIFGPKGGIGKTTLASNLAIALHNQSEGSVAVADVDTYFGDLAMMMGLEPEHHMLDLVSAMRKGGASPSDFMTRHSSGVDVLAAPHSAAAGPQPTVDEVATIIQKLAETYPFVVVDTPGTFNPLVATALDEATMILVTTSADVSSIKDTRLSLELLRGFDSDKVKLLVDRATNAQSVSDADLAKAVGYSVFWSLPHDREVSISTQHGTPIVVANPKTKMAMGVDALAATLCNRTTDASAASQAKPRRGLFSSFMKKDPASFESPSWARSGV